MTSGQSITLSMLVVLAVVVLALSRPTRGFWSTLFTHNRVTLDLKMPSLPFTGSGQKPEATGGTGGAGPNWAWPAP